MSKLPRAITNLVDKFECLPGIGPKSAQRLVFYLLHHPERELRDFGDKLVALKTEVVLCSECHHVSETDPCDICADSGRDKNIICVVEQPLDVLAMERGNGYRGVYHVLHGVIDPLHNIGPDEIKLNELIKRIEQSKPIEIVLALNPNMEGEATCLFIKKQLKDIKVTRLAHGLPMGADIEYADEQTLTHAMEGRREY